MNVDDICPGLSEQPKDIQTRVVASRLHNDLLMLSVMMPRDCQPHLTERVERMIKRFELLDELMGNDEKASLV